MINLYEILIVIVIWLFIIDQIFWVKFLYYIYTYKLKILKLVRCHQLSKTTTGLFLNILNFVQCE